MSGYDLFQLLWYLKAQRESKPRMTRSCPRGSGTVDVSIGPSNCSWNPPHSCPAPQLYMVASLMIRTLAKKLLSLFGLAYHCAACFSALVGSPMFGKGTGGFKVGSAAIGSSSVQTAS